MDFTISRLWRSRQQLWVYVIAGLFAGDFVLCGYLPSQARLTALQQARAEQSRTITLATGQGQELAALKQRLQNAQKMADRYDACVPTEGALGAFQQRIAAIITEHHLTDQVFIPGNEVEQDGVTCIPVQITCRGTLGNMFAFFRDLQAMDRLVRIEKVLLKNDPDFSGQLSMQTETVIFYRSSTRRETNHTAGVKPAGGTSNGT